MCFFHAMRLRRASPWPHNRNRSRNQIESAPIILSVQIRSVDVECTLGRCTLVQWANSLERVTWNRGKTPQAKKSDELLAKSRELRNGR